MDFDQTQNYMQREYGVHDYINIKIERKCWHDYDPSGIYQLFPYYVKVSPEDIGTSRFVIQKHAFNNEWQLTEIYDHISRRTICPFSDVIEKVNKSSAKITVESFLNFKQKYIEKEEEFEKKIFSIESQIHEFHADAKELVILNENLKLEITDLKSKNANLIKKKETQIQNLNSEGHLQEKTFEEKLNVHSIDLKKIYSEKQEKLKETFNQQLIAKETEIHNFHTKFKEMEIRNQNVILKITDLKSENVNIMKEKKNQIQNLNSEKKIYSENEKKLKKEFDNKIFSKETEIHNLQEKVNELEILNENLKLEITDLNTKYSNVKSDLKFQSELLKKKVLEHKLTEVKVKVKKLELKLKDQTYQTFLKECEFSKQSKKKQKPNASLEQKINLDKNIIAITSQDTLNEIKKIKDGKYFPNPIDESLKTQKLEQKFNSTILPTETNVNLCEKEIENNLEKNRKTKTKAPNDQKSQTFDSSQNLTDCWTKQDKHTNAFKNIFSEIEKNLREHKNTSEQSLVDKISNTPSLVKTINEIGKNIKKEEIVSGNKNENKYKDECKTMMLHATTMYDNYFFDWIKEYRKHPDLMPKIADFLKNKDNLKMNPNLHYEFALMYWGAIFYVEQEQKEIKDSKYIYVYADVLQKLRDNYKKNADDAMLNIQEIKQQILIKCLIGNMKLFEEKQYQYEVLIFNRGYYYKAPKEILEELKKSI